MFIEMDPLEFDHFTNRYNMTGVVLQVHFLALEMAMRPWLKVGNVAFHQHHNHVLRNTVGSLFGGGSVEDAERFERLISWPRRYLGSGGEVFGVCHSLKMLSPSSLCSS